MIAGIGYLAYVAYRETKVQTALSEARQFIPAKAATPSQSPPGPLAFLRPHPWSSPLHNQKFDEAIAGARAAYDRGDYERANRVEYGSSADASKPGSRLAVVHATRRLLPRKE